MRRPGSAFIAIPRRNERALHLPPARLSGVNHHPPRGLTHFKLTLALLDTRTDTDELKSNFHHMHAQFTS